jgi:porin
VKLAPLSAMKMKPSFMMLRVGAPEGVPARTLLLALALAGLLASPLAAQGEGPSPADEQAAQAVASGDAVGLRERLARRGVEVMLILQGDPSANLTGGLRQGTAMRVPVHAALDLDMERLLGWRGGRLHAAVQGLEGRNASEHLVGDLQGFNNADSQRLRQVSEAWLEQRLLRDRLRLKLGKADANTDFARVDSSGEFLNSSAGYSPTIQGFPSDPDPAASVSLFASPAGWLSLGAGVYDGATHEGCHGRTGNSGPGTLFGSPDALFAVGELGIRYSLGGRPGRLTVGSWRHTGTFEGEGGATRRGISGLYAVLEQRILQEPGDGTQGIVAFAQFGASDGRWSEVEQHAALGLAATGALPGRDRDVLGLMLTSVVASRLCPTAGGSRRESVLELYYGVAVRPWLMVKPDLQHIKNPGAGGVKDALVGTLRVTLAF